jgi:hypothetical protein
VAVLAHALVEAFGRITYVGAAPALPGAPEGPVLADAGEGQGPPGALRTVLAHSPPGWLAVCALDLPKLTVEDLHTLRREALACRDARVVAPRSEGYGHLLAGAWHTDALRFFPTGRPDAASASSMASRAVIMVSSRSARARTGRTSRSRSRPRSLGVARRRPK